MMLGSTKIIISPPQINSKIKRAKDVTIEKDEKKINTYNTDIFFAFQA